MKKLIFIFLPFLISNHISATQLLVPGTYPTIQSALNACFPGDTVLVTQGTYIENIVWPGINGIKLLSAGTSNTTIISANNSGKVISISAVSVDTSTVIKGFTITSGNITSGSGYGAGIYINNGSVIMDDLVVVANRVNVPGGHAHGAGVHLTSSSSIIRNCYINNNSVDSATWCYGGGVYISGGSPTITDTEISGNSMNAENWCYGVGLYATNNASLTMNRVKVTSNYSGNDAIWYYGNGIYVDDITGSFTNLLVVENKSGTGGSFNYGGGIFCDGISNINIVNSTIAGNSKTGNGTINGSGVYARDAIVTLLNCIAHNTNTGMELNTGGGGTITATYSNIRNGYSGTGNINLVPGFVAPGFDYHLQPTSLSAGVGSLAGAPLVDIEGTMRPLPAATNPDMGCYEVDQSLTGLSEFENQAINVYPNPVVSGNEVTVVNLNGDFVISDFVGRIIFKGSANSHDLKINTSEWNSGWYFIRSSEGDVLKFGVVND